MKGDQRVTIQDKPLDLLLYLIRHRDRVVHREELLREVWPDVSVGRQALGFALHGVRAALGDDGKRQTLLRTFSRRGVQFTAAITAEPRAKVEQSERVEYSLPFLNRERLHTESEGVLARVLRGTGQVLLIHGEAGIGKTRSLKQIADLAASYGFRVSHGQGVPGDQAPAYWPWVQILRESLASAPPESQSSIIDDGALQLASLIPELREVIGKVSSKALKESRTTRFLLFDGVSRFIQSTSLGSPVGLLIDDLQFCDSGSLALFEHVARGLRDSRVFLVGSFRDTGIPASPDLAHAIFATAHSDSCRVLELTALPLAGIQEFIISTYGVVPSSVVANHLLSRTNGNPFFLGQLLRVLETAGRLAELMEDAVPEIELPLQIRTAIGRQVLALPENVVRVLEAASVAGRDFRVIDLQKIKASAAELTNSLEVAADAGVIRRSGQTGSFSFTHVLVRDAVYGSLSSEERILLHRSIGSAIEEDAVISHDLDPTQTRFSHGA